jgi:hypothetical protein
MVARMNARDNPIHAHGMHQLVFNGTSPRATHCSHMDRWHRPPCITPCNMDMSVLKNTPSGRRLLRSVSDLEHKHVEKTTPSDMLCSVLASQLVDNILAKVKIHRQCGIHHVSGVV